MSSIILRMGRVGLVVRLGASLQDPTLLDVGNSKRLPLQRQTRMLSATESLRGYLNALNRGYGSYKLYRGCSYVGSPKIGVPHGQGTKTWANGDRYEGQWVAGERHGQGTYSWANGGRYEGQWVAGEHHGQGIYSWADGSRYKGQWVAGERRGQGTKTWADGERYEGEWVAGEYHGQGTCSWANGDRYEGQWTRGWPGDFAMNPNLFMFQDFKSPLTLKKTCLHALILQSTGDHNGAFGIKEGHCELLAKALAVGGYKGQVIYFSSPAELEKELGAVKRKIDLVWIRAHGYGSKIVCGPNKGWTKIVWPSLYGDVNTLSPLTPVLNKTCSVVFESCHTGKPNMLAEQYFQRLSKSGKSPTVIAPNGSPRFRGVYLDALKSGDLKVLMLAIQNGKVKDLTTKWSK